MDVLTTIEWELNDRGTYHAETEFSPEDWALLNRAMMRAESRLLLKDADNLDADSVCRTSEQRSLDALVQIEQPGTPVFIQLRHVSDSAPKMGGEVRVLAAIL